MNKNIPEYDLDPVKDDLTESNKYGQKLDVIQGKYDSIEELLEAYRDVTFLDKIKLTLQGKTDVGRIAGTALDIAGLIAPEWAVRVRHRIQSKIKPKKMNWIKNRLKERTTWQGIISIITAIGIALNPEQKEAVISLGMAIVTAIWVFKKEPQSKDAQ